MKIPFYRPYLTGHELEKITQVLNHAHLSGNGEFTKLCQKWLEQNIGSEKALLTHSCTAALEMAAILIDVKPGDEIIMPSYTFVSTANAFVLRGGIPVFVDIRADTLCIDVAQIEKAITKKTKAIVPVHYASVACDMDAIMAIAKQHGLYVIEDAAQCILAQYKNKPLGGIGHLGALSFHATKNITCGEGGALLINDPTFIERAEYIWEKGTNRSNFLAGKIDKYTWVDIGSSFLPAEMLAAMLWAQLQMAQSITKKRLSLWDRYQHNLQRQISEETLRLPIIPNDCQHNAHLYYLLAKNEHAKIKLANHLTEQQIGVASHYSPLHLAPAARCYAKPAGVLPVTERVAKSLLRLPLYAGLEVSAVDAITQAVWQVVQS